MPEFQRGGIFTNCFIATRKLLYDPYLPNVRRVRGGADVAHPSTANILQKLGFHPVYSFHVGLYSYHNNTPKEKVVEELSAGNTHQRLFTPADGNLTSIKSYDQFSDQLKVVDSPCIPWGTLFVDTFVYSATTTNLSTLMKRCHFYGSFDGGNTLSALSYGGASYRGDDSTWWCIISATNSGRVEDIVKANCQSALQYAEKGKSGSPVHLACYFTDINTKNAVDAVLARIGFQVCDTLPGYRKLSHIIYYECDFI